MNRNTYRLIFSKVRSAIVVVAENAGDGAAHKTVGTSVGTAARPPREPSLMASLLQLALAGAVASLAMLPKAAVSAGAAPNSLLSTSLGTGTRALPQGASVVTGSAILAQNGKTLTVQQNSAKLTLNWQSFSIGAGNTVVFNQPSTSSVALNRVIGSDASQIMGNLRSNGQVFLVNPNGVLFGRSASVDVGSLVASTSALTDSNFKSGNYSFTSANTGGAQILNQGAIKVAPGGSLVLVGDQVINQGSLSASQGQVILAAGDTVNLALDGGAIVGVSVSGSVLKALVDNAGLIVADGGQVQLTAHGRDTLLATVVNNTGVIQATAVHRSGGTIVLDGGTQGDVLSSGVLNVSGLGAGQVGGNVTLTGQNVGLVGNASSILKSNGTNATANIASIGNLTFTANTQNLSGSVFSGTSDNLSLVALNAAAPLSLAGTGAAFGNLNVAGSGGTMGIQDTANIASTGNLTFAANTQNLSGAVFSGTSDDLSLVALNSAQPLVLSGSGASFGNVGAVQIGGASDAASFSDQNAGVNKPVSITGITLGGTDAGNYVLASSSTNTTSAISVANLTITALTQTKTYDGTLNVTNASAFASNGLASNDSIVGAALAYTDQNAGASNKTIVANYAVAGSGTLLSNYYVTYVITAVTGITATKIYDGSTSATPNNTGAIFVGMVSGDNLTVASDTATLSNKNAGAPQTVSITGITLGGTDSGNYVLSSSNASTTATVAAADLTITALTQSKPFDGTILVPNQSGFTVSGLAANESLASANLSFTNASVGPGNKTIVVSAAVAAAGTSLSDYNVIYDDNTHSSITAATGAGPTNQSTRVVPMDQMPMDIECSHIDREDGTRHCGVPLWVIKGKGAADIGSANSGKGALVRGYEKGAYDFLPIDAAQQRPPFEDAGAGTLLHSD